MSIFNFLSKNKDIEQVSPDELQSLVIYNTEYNLVILISFGYNHFYSIFEFLDAAHRAGLKTLISHYAKEIEDNNEEFKISIRNLIDNRYYILIAGEPDKYAKLYDYLSLSNEVLIQLTEDFYNNCDARKFTSILEYDNLVLSKDKFKYKTTVPKYDDRVIFENTIIRKQCLADDILLGILNKVGNLFDPIDIGRIVNIYYNMNHGTIIDYMTVEELAKKALKKSNDEIATDNDIYYYKLLQLACNHSIVRQIFNELGDPSPVPIEKLYVYVSPIFMREDLSNKDNMVNPDVTIDKLDEIFREKYDKFNTPTAEYADSYKGIDEYITSNSDDTLE